MPTLKLTILRSKPARDGSFKIRVALAHKRIVSYIVTPFSVPSLSHFKDGQVVGADSALVNMKLRNLLNDYQETLLSIKNTKLYDCSQLREIITNRTNGQTAALFRSVSEEYIKELEEDGRANYGKLLERNCRYFMEFAKGEVLLSEITPQLINNYARFLRNKKGLGETSVGMALSRTRTIINRAKKHQLVKYDVDPFAFTRIEASPERELDLSVEDVRRIRDSVPSKHKLRVARDLFMLSFYLGGINLVDLLQIDFRNKVQIEYVRTKSRNTKQGDKRISITIPEEAKPIISQWMKKSSGKLDFGYKFSYENFSRYLSRCLAELAKELNIGAKVVYYSARKSFVQHGFELGVPLEVLEYTIGQSMKANRPIFNYVKIMRKHADAAIRKILDNLNE